MKLFQLIAQKIFINLIGLPIYYLLRKIIGDTNSYKVIRDKSNLLLTFWIGCIITIIIMIYLIESTK